MTVARWHLAQLDVGRVLAPLDSGRLAGFVAQLDPINALADAAPGLVWRLQTGEGNATSLRPTDSGGTVRRPDAFTFHAPFRPEADRQREPMVDAEFCWPELTAS